MRTVRRLLPPAEYRRWLGHVIKAAPAVIARRTLGVVDERLGEDLSFCAPDGRFLHTQGAAFGVVREIFGHRCYAEPAQLRDARHILDLGANAGVFTLFALSCAPEARVHSVEAQPHFLPVIHANVAVNRFAERTTVENAIVGGSFNEWTQSLRSNHPQVADFSISRYLSKVGQCDFLKCDVEGAEFELFQGDLEWLGAVRGIALEYHGDWAAGATLCQRIAAAGFTSRQAERGALGYIFAERR